MPTAAPANVEADGFNSTAMEVTWDPVEDSRLVMKGRLYGYQVSSIFCIFMKIKALLNFINVTYTYVITKIIICTSFFLLLLTLP